MKAAAAHITHAPEKSGRLRPEPWLANYYRALRARREPLIYLLVSWDEAIQVADGAVPRRLQKQARRMLGTALPRAEPDI